MPTHYRRGKERTTQLSVEQVLGPKKPHTPLRRQPAIQVKSIAEFLQLPHRKRRQLVT